jgi:Ni/Fe-hydrogenase subunit HybB-like protein
VTTVYNTRVIITKAVLWLLVGAATAVAVSRYVRGLGATTALTDATPWGLWIGFDVLSGVALAAGGFVIAATVYIFHLDRYHGLVRPAVLTAFLGYVAVALGLLADLGRPWNIWRMIIFWQPESPLFEVGWCVMLYLTVLALEFVPVIFEGLHWMRPLRIMRHLTLVLVIAGIGLSTLHQSSLGTLFLLAQDRMHPLWYSPILPLLFFVSAVGLGLMMVATESTVTSWLYHREGEWPILRGLTRAASIVLLVYCALRIGDLAVRGQLGHLLESGWLSFLFIVELGLSVVIPIVLFTLPWTRGTRWAVTVGSFSGVAGFVLHRADVGGITHMAVTGQLYLPALTEILISVGLVSAMALVFLFFVERFPVWEEQPPLPEHFTPPITDPVTGTYFGGQWFGRAQLAGAAWVLGVVLGVAVLETTTHGGELPNEVAVRAPRAVAALRIEEDGKPSSRLVLLEMAEVAADFPEGLTTGLLIDGDRQGRAVLFDHDGHQQRLGGEASCGRCHHRNLPLDRGTPCTVCHSDMYRCTDIFDHQEHVATLGANESCQRCHRDPAVGKARATATPCLECHASDIIDCFTEERHPCVSHSHVGDTDCSGCHDFDPAATVRDDTWHRQRCGVAPGYRLAMHRLCIDCHCVEESEAGAQQPYLSRCSCCHGHSGSEIDVEPELMVQHGSQETGKSTNDHG